MKRRLKIPSLALLMILVVAGLGLRSFLEREPSYEGKVLSTWLQDFDLESVRPPEKAKQAVRTIGTNSFPLLRRMLGATDPLWKKAVIALNAKQSFIQLPITEANVFRYRAVQGYRALGAAAKPEVGGLINLLDSNLSADVRSDVATALGGIGPEAKAAIPWLSKAALDQSSELRTSALSALANIQGLNFEKPGSYFRPRGQP
jgi:hypothetical protein